MKAIIVEDFPDRKLGLPRQFKTAKPIDLHFAADLFRGLSKLRHGKLRQLFLDRHCPLVHRERISKTMDISEGPDAIIPNSIVSKDIDLATAGGDPNDMRMDHFAGKKVVVLN